MATKIKVHGAKGTGKFMHLEVSGGVSGKMGDGTHEFTIGAQGGMVQYLSIKRLGQGDITVLAETGELTVEVDDNKPKQIKKGHRFTVPSRAKSVSVRETPRRQSI